MLKSLHTLALAVIATFLSFTLIACSDDEPGNSADENMYVSVDITYAIDLSQTFFDYYDITATYLDQTGKEVTTKLDKNMLSTVSIPEAKAPETCIFNITGTLKDDYPAIDESAKYSMHCSGYMKVAHVRKDGKATSMSLPMSESNLTIPGTRFKDYLDRYTERTFTDLTINLSDVTNKN